MRRRERPARSTPTVSAEEFVESMRRRLDETTGEGRVVIGLAAPPGAGKSTLAGRLATELGAVAAPMDGFHLRNAELDRRRLRHRKGAPETFDAEGFVDRVRAVVAGDHDVAWPSFDRVVDEPIDDAIVVSAQAPFVVVEGNYLLLDRPPWRALPTLLDDVAYLELATNVRVGRLIDRHVAHGRSQSAAVAFVARSDERNARLVEASRPRASVIVAMR